MSDHTYDWGSRLSETAEHCYHLAVSELGEQKGIDGKVGALLANCVRCGNTIAVNGNYRKTDRVLGNKPIYVKFLHK